MSTIPGVPDGHNWADRWNDLVAPATAINPPGQVSDPDWDTSIPGWLFDATAVESLDIVFQLPHTVKISADGGVLKPHCHWTKTTSDVGNVVWQIDYRWAKIGEVIGGEETLSAYQAVSGTFDSNTANEHLITSLGTIEDLTFDISDMLLVKLSRVADDANDTYAADARLLEFDIHINHTRDGGSVGEYTRVRR